MVKKILILVDKIGPKKETLAQYVAERLGEKAHITLARFSDLYFEIDNKSSLVLVNDTPVTDYDLIYFRRAGDQFSGVASNLAVYLKAKKVNFIDKSWAEVGPIGSKFTALMKLSLNHLPIIKSIYVWRDEISRNKERIIKKLGLPLIAKELSTQRGKGVIKITKAGDFDSLPMTDSKGGPNQYLFQKYVELKDEYRLLVLGDRVGVWEKKIVTTKGEFRHNVSLGASEEFLKINDIPDNLEKIAVNGAAALNVQIAGVDIATDKTTGEYYLIEINRGPGFTYDTKISPEMDELAKYFGKEANN
jgi:glutathione synthase/RimK-type ligase-like ATP-grasp enzyme